MYVLFLILVYVIYIYIYMHVCIYIYIHTYVFIDLSIYIYDIIYVYVCHGAWSLPVSSKKLRDVNDATFNILSRGVAVLIPYQSKLKIRNPS